MWPLEIHAADNAAVSVLQMRNRGSCQEGFPRALGWSEAEEGVNMLRKTLCPQQPELVGNWHLWFCGFLSED